MFGMSLMNKLSQLAKSQQGKELLDKAKTFANDPETRKKIDDARDKLNGHVDTAKQKMAEKKAKDGEASPTYGEETAKGTPPTYGEETPAANGAQTPGDAPAYGEETPTATPPTYGEDGPKAA